jgi:hypothetical protein
MHYVIQEICSEFLNSNKLHGLDQSLILEI